MIRARSQVVLFDLGNTLFYDNAAGLAEEFILRAEAALWRALRRSGVIAIPAASLWEGRYAAELLLRPEGDGLEEPGTFRVLRDLLLPHVARRISDATITRALRAMYARDPDQLAGGA